MCNVSVKLNQRRSVDQVPLVEGLSEEISFNLELNDCTDEALRMSSDRLFQTCGTKCRKARALILVLDGITESFQVSADERSVRREEAMLILEYK